MNSEKNILIFGDSYSTFEGYIPEGYAVCYSEKSDIEFPRRVEQTWWHQVAREKNATIWMNNSWSGSTIGFTGYENEDCSTSSSFIYRLEKMIADGTLEGVDIDTIFVFGGTNDSWAGAPAGTLKFDDIDRQELYTVLPAISYFMKLLKSTFPQSNILWIINTLLTEEITEAMKTAADHYGIPYLMLQDIDKSYGHPTVLGMNQIKEQVLQKLK